VNYYDQAQETLLEMAEVKFTPGHIVDIYWSDCSQEWVVVFSDSRFEYIGTYEQALEWLEP